MNKTHKRFWRLIKVLSDSLRLEQGPQFLLKFPPRKWETSEKSSKVRHRLADISTTFPSRDNRGIDLLTSLRMALRIFKVVNEGTRAAAARFIAAGGET